MKGAIPARALPARTLPAPLLIGAAPTDGFRIHPDHRFYFLGAPRREFEFRRDRWTDS